MKRFMMAALASTFLAFSGCGEKTADTDDLNDRDSAHDAALDSSVADNSTADSANDSSVDAGADATDPDYGVDGVADSANTDADATDKDTGDDQGGEDVNPPPVPPHGLCGMPAYDLMDPAELGEVVESEYISMFDLDSSSIDALLAAANFQVLSPVPYGSKAYRFRYTTQDRGQKVEATAMLAFPVDAEPFVDELPVLLYDHGTSGFSDPCAPSHESKWLQDGALPPALASLGFVVIAPDYIGMASFGGPSTVRHGYLVAEQTAIGSWDAVRAGLKLLETIKDHPTASNRVSLWGPSQGGHAVLFTEQWAPYYAPEFEVPAVVSLVPPSDLMPLMQRAVSSLNDSSGLFAISMVTMQIWYGGTADLETVFTDEDPYFVADRAPTLLFPTDECRIDIGVDLDDVTIETVLQTDFINAAVEGRWDDIGPWKCYYMENSLATTSVPPLRFTPTLMVYGQTDELVDTPRMRNDFERLCNLGYKMDYMECAGAGHTQAAIWSMPEQFQWIRDRLAGIPVPENEVCAVQEPVVCSGTPESTFSR